MVVSAVSGPGIGVHVGADDVPEPGLAVVEADDQPAIDQQRGKLGSTRIDELGVVGDDRPLVGDGARARKYADVLATAGVDAAVRTEGRLPEPTDALRPMFLA